MRTIIQRVKKASVKVEDSLIAEIDNGLLALVSFEDEETKEDFDWCIRKLINLRIFNDKEGVMNLSVQDISGELLIVSQFTLHANCKKGNRPSYIRAAKPTLALTLYQEFLNDLRDTTNCAVKEGSFGANMEVSLINDGPITIILDSKNKDN